MSFGFGFGFPKNYVAALFSPSSLFAAGEQGAWYDPSDFNPTWRRNLLRYTEQFDDAVWTKTDASISANAGVAPDGTLTADKLVENTAGARHRVIGSSTVTTSGVYSLTAHFKKSERKFAALVVVANSPARIYTVVVDLDSGAQTATSVSGTPGSTGYSVTDAGNGWWRVSVQMAVTAGETVQPQIATSDSGNPVFVGAVPYYVGDGTSGIYIWGAQLEVGSTASTYQRITDGVQDYYTYGNPQPVLFQDSAGTTPVTAVEQSVGLMLDKSKGLVRGPELAPVSEWNGVTANASVDSVNSTFTVTASSAFGQGVNITKPVAAGRWYEISFTINFAIAGAGARARVGQSDASPTLTTSGTYRYITLASTTNAAVIFSAGTGTTFTVSSISVRELPGNHAFQSTSTARPVLSSRVNLLTKTEQFDDAAWVKTQSTVSANSTIAPNGAQTADTFLDVSGASFAEIKQVAVAVVSGPQYRYTIKAKKGTKRYVYMSLTNARFGAGAEAYFDLELGVVKTSGAAAISASVAQDAEGFYTCGFSANCTSSGNAELFVYHVNDAGTSVLYTGTGTGSIYIWGADLRVANVGVNLPAYQRVNTATDYDTAGFPLYLRFDGVDDFLQTNSIDFSATDKMTVWAGVRKLSDAAAGIVGELGTQDSVAGGFGFGASGATGDPSRRTWFIAQEAAGAGISLTGRIFPSPETDVLTGLWDRSQATQSLEMQLRVSGVVPTTAFSAANLATGNFGNYPLYIGRRGGTTLPFNGYLYGLIVRGAQSTPAQITSAENWVNTRTKAY